MPKVVRTASGGGMNMALPRIPKRTCVRLGIENYGQVSALVLKVGVRMRYKTYSSLRYSHLNRKMIEYAP